MNVARLDLFVKLWFNRTVGCSPVEPSLCVCVCVCVCVCFEHVRSWCDVTPHCLAVYQAPDLDAKNVIVGSAPVAADTPDQATWPSQEGMVIAVLCLNGSRECACACACGGI
jgi:hypothetical protein